MTNLLEPPNKPLEPIKWVTPRGIDSRIHTFPVVFTAEEIQEFIFETEVQLEAIEEQLKNWDQYQVWPKENAWTSCEDWLDSTVSAKQIKKYQISVAKKTLQRVKESQPKTTKTTSVKVSTIGTLTKEVNALKTALAKEVKSRTAQAIQLSNQCTKVNDKRANLEGKTANDLALIYRVLYDNGLLNIPGERYDAIRLAIQNNPDYGFWALDADEANEANEDETKELTNE